MIDTIRPYLRLEYGLGLTLLVGVAVLFYLSAERGKVEDERVDFEGRIVAVQEAEPAVLDERDAASQRLFQLSSELQVLEASIPDAGIQEINTRREALAVIGQLTDYLTDREMAVASFNSEEVTLGGEAEGTTIRAIRYALRVSGTASELAGLLRLSEQAPNAGIRELSFSRLATPDAIWEITLVFDVLFA